MNVRLIFDVSPWRLYLFNLTLWSDAGNPAQAAKLKDYTAFLRNLMTVETLTLLSTTFIVLGGLSLLLGWCFIRWLKNEVLHRNTMLTATTFAGLFLVSCIVRWFLYGSKPFPGEGGWKIFYFVNLVCREQSGMIVAPADFRFTVYDFRIG